MLINLGLKYNYVSLIFYLFKSIYIYIYNFFLTETKKDYIINGLCTAIQYIAKKRKDNPAEQR